MSANHKPPPKTKRAVAEAASEWHAGQVEEHFSTLLSDLDKIDRQAQKLRENIGLVFTHWQMSDLMKARSKCRK